MKRLTALILALVLLAAACIAYAGTAGTVDNPLISLSYLNNTFKADIKDDLIAAAGEGLAKDFDEASAALDEVYDMAVMRTGGYTGYTLTDGFVNVSLDANEAVSALTGTTVMLTKGTASLAVTRGSVINISTGEEVRSGESLVANQRYFCAEYTQARFKATKDTTILVDGWYTTTYVSNVTYTDVSADQWFYSQVAFCTDIGLFKGVTETEFMPAMTMNMAQLVQVLYRIAGNTDASGEYWYSAAEKWAVDAGIITQAEFVPAGQVTRERFISMFYACCDYLGTFDMSPRADITGATDYSSVSLKYADEISWAVAVKLIIGSDANSLTIRPSATVNRAEVCTMIQRFYQNM